MLEILSLRKYLNINELEGGQFAQILITTTSINIKL